MVMPHVNGRGSSRQNCYRLLCEKAQRWIKKGREADESDTARTDFTHFAERPRQLTRMLLIR